MRGTFLWNYFEIGPLAWEEMSFKGFSSFSPVRPFCLGNFGRGSPKEHSCKIILKSIHRFRRRCLLSKLLTDARRTKTGHKSSPLALGSCELKRAITQPIFGGRLPISNLTCILCWYKGLQSLNEIIASLQKLLPGNEQQKLSRKRAITQPKFGRWLPISNFTCIL